MTFILCTTTKICHLMSTLLVNLTNVKLFYELRKMCVHISGKAENREIAYYEYFDGTSFLRDLKCCAKSIQLFFVHSRLEFRANE